MLSLKGFMMRFLCLLFCGFLMFLPAPVSAATIDDLEKNFVVNPRQLDSWRASVKHTTPRYAEGVRMLKRATKNRRKNVVTTLRAYYSRTQQYNPFAQDILDEMTEYGYIIDTSDDSLAVNEALLNYRALLDLHIVNLDVVSFALTLSRVDIRFGDEFLLKDIRDTLITEFSGGGLNGKEPRTAFKIVTFAEEAYIIEGYRPVTKTTELFEVGNRYYNVHDIVDEDGNQHLVYIEITIPIRSILMSAKAERAYQALPNRPR